MNYDFDVTCENLMKNLFASTQLLFLQSSINIMSRDMIAKFEVFTNFIFHINEFVIAFFMNDIFYEIV